MRKRDWVTPASASLLGGFDLDFFRAEKEATVRDGNLRVRPVALRRSVNFHRCAEKVQVADDEVVVVVLADLSLLRAFVQVARRSERILARFVLQQHVDVLDLRRHVQLVRIRVEPPVR